MATFALFGLAFGAAAYFALEATDPSAPQVVSQQR